MRVTTGASFVVTLRPCPCGSNDVDLRAYRYRSAPFPGAPEVGLEVLFGVGLVHAQPRTVHVAGQDGEAEAARLRPNPSGARHTNQWTMAPASRNKPKPLLPRLHHGLHPEDGQCSPPPPATHQRQVLHHAHQAELLHLVHVRRPVVQQVVQQLGLAWRVHAAGMSIGTITQRAATLVTWCVGVWPRAVRGKARRWQPCRQEVSKPAAASDRACCCVRPSHRTR